MVGKKLDQSSVSKSSDNFRNIITLDDVNDLAHRIGGPTADVLKYHVNSYSDIAVGFVGQHLQLELVLKNGDCSETISLFLKTIPRNDSIQTSYILESGSFQREVDFFTHMFPCLTDGFQGNQWAPRCYLIRPNILIFEDMRPRGFSMKKIPFDEETIKSALSSVAQMHASSILAEIRLGKPLNVAFPEANQENCFNGEGLSSNWFEAGINVAVAVAKQLGLNHEIVPGLCRKVFDILVPSSTMRNVLSHGDLWCNNMMFDQSHPPKCVLVDFQRVHYAPLARDVWLIIYLLTDQEFRTNHAQKLIEYYYSVLCKILNDNDSVLHIPPFEEILDNEQRFGAIITAVIYYPVILLSDDVGAEVIKDPTNVEKFIFRDRTVETLLLMQQNSFYAKRIREIVEELITFAEHNAIH